MSVQPYKNSFSISNLHISIEQIQDIVSNYGLVVISRSGSNPQLFIYESDLLTRLQVNSFNDLSYAVQLDLYFLSFSQNGGAEKYQHSSRMDYE